MIITLPFSKRIKEFGFQEIEDIIDAIEYKNFKDSDKYVGIFERIFHSSEALLDINFKLKKEEIK